MFSCCSSFTSMCQNGRKLVCYVRAHGQYYFSTLSQKQCIFFSIFCLFVRVQQRKHTRDTKFVGATVNCNRKMKSCWIDLKKKKSFPKFTKSQHSESDSSKFLYEGVWRGLIPNFHFEFKKWDKLHSISFVPLWKRPVVAIEMDPLPPKYEYLLDDVNVLYHLYSRTSMTMPSVNFGTKHNPEAEHFSSDG